MISVNLVVHIFAILALFLLAIWCLLIKKERELIQEIIELCRHNSHKKFVLEKPAAFLMKSCNAFNIHFSCDDQWKSKYSKYKKLFPRYFCGFLLNLSISKVEVDENGILFIVVNGSKSDDINLTSEKNEFVKSFAIQEIKIQYSTNEGK